MMYWLFLPAIAAVSVWFAFHFGGVAWAFTAGLSVGVLCCFFDDELVEWQVRRQR